MKAFAPWRSKVKLWKVAISLAIVGALAAPFILGTWKLRPTEWVPFTEEQRQEIENRVNSCKDISDKGERFFCEYFNSNWLKEGGEYVNNLDSFKYWIINLVVALVMFVGIFGLSIVILKIALRYWGWLKT
jgi:hypothetical protein